MREYLEATTSRPIFSHHTFYRCFKTCGKIKYHLFRDVLPTLLIILVLGELTLKTVEYMD
jgi:hypothetical protein